MRPLHATVDRAAPCAEDRGATLMKPVPATAALQRASGSPPPALPEIVRSWQRGPGVPLLMAAVFLASLLLPRVHGNPRMLWSFVGVGVLLLGWTAWLATRRAALPQAFRIDLLRPRKQHYIQSTVQLCVYAYWGWYWREVYQQIPLFVAQLVFLYTLDALISWTRGRPWLLGFGPLPIILSTNVFIWFKDDWFAWQFALVALGALGKEFIKWRREGRLTHIFNPSAFTLSLFSIALIASGNTDKTLGLEIATTIFRPPHIYLEIFLLGLVVQYFFSVTLMTLSAAALLFALNTIYTAQTGVYYFVDTNISAAVFLGFHLLVTDPSTSPRSNTGKVLFGLGYGLAIWTLYWVLGQIGAPQFYDKLLPIPLLNLSVKGIDRLVQSGWLGRLTRWEAHFPRQRVNLVYMGCWTALFSTMLLTGFVEKTPHPGSSIAFWNQAYKDGKPGAGLKLLNMVSTRVVKDDPVALNVMGGLLLKGELVVKDPAAAAYYFARSCELGNPRGCANLAYQFLYENMAESKEAVARALDTLEASCGTPVGAGEMDLDQGQACWLVGYAYEIGEGRPQDGERALQYYRQGAGLGSMQAVWGLVRSDLSTMPDLMQASQALTAACTRGDPQQEDGESCFWLAALSLGKNGFPGDKSQAQPLLERACALGYAEGCESLARARKP